MSQGISVIIYPVKDIAAAKALYGTFLGVEPYADAPYYVGYRIGDQEIGLAPSYHGQGVTGPICFRETDDIKRSLNSLLEAGATTHEAPKDVGGGMLVASVKDVDGNVIGLRQSPR
jgi:predicted enzyme related to lactoylglutathione lyase